MMIFGHAFRWGGYPTHAPGTLAEVTPGRPVQVTGFCQGISPDRWAQLQSYGLVPGMSVQVIQHSPVTIVQIDHLELALEADLARLIQVHSLPA